MIDENISKEQLTNDLIDLLSTGIIRAPDGMLFKLKNEQPSEYMLDLSRVVHNGWFFQLFCEYLKTIKEIDTNSNVIGPSMSADPICAAFMAAKGASWIRWRDKPKGRGINPRNRLISNHFGSCPPPVYVVDDVLTTGKTLKTLMDDFAQFNDYNFDLREVIVLVARENAPDQINGLIVNPLFRFHDGVITACDFDAERRKKSIMAHTPVRIVK